MNQEEQAKKNQEMMGLVAQTLVDFQMKIRLEDVEKNGDGILRIRKNVFAKKPDQNLVIQKISDIFLEYGRKVVLEKVEKNGDLIIRVSKS